MKSYYVMYRVGRVKYLVNFWDGVKTHNDGSKFYDIKTANNLKDLNKILLGLAQEGYAQA